MTYLDVLTIIMTIALLISCVGGLIVVLWLAAFSVCDWWTRRCPHGRYAARRS